MKFPIRNFLALCLTLSAVAGRAQSLPPIVTASVEPDSISIGDRFDIRVRVEQDAMQVVGFPDFHKRQQSAIEFLGEWPVDTVSRVGRRVVLEKRYTMTVFDEGNYSLGKIGVLYADKNVVDTLFTTDTLRLMVTTFPIDTTIQKIVDIKPPLNTPFRLGEVAGYTWKILLALILLAGIVVGVIYLMRNRATIIVRSKPAEPPHVIALRELDKIGAQKMWLMSERQKVYYTHLIDVVREYISDRYGFGAMEMTTDEIVENLALVGTPPETVRSLTGALRMADLVKFAKYTAGAEEGEEVYYTARNFVEDTLVQPETKERHETEA